jgi:hypothetical protein
MLCYRLMGRITSREKEMTCAKVLGYFKVVEYVSSPAPLFS